jgi:gliding motility-associated-like protein
MQKVSLLILSCLLNMATWAHDFQAPELEYIENKGQWDSRVQFKADLHGGWAFLQNQSIRYLFYDHTAIKHGPERVNGLREGISESFDTARPKTFNAQAYEVSWIGANQTIPQATSVEPHHYNFFTHPDPSRWKSQVRATKKVKYNNLYPNIDLEVYSMGASMKSDYIVRKGGNPADIRLQYEGINQMQLLSDGRLLIVTSVTDVFEYEPYAYQKINGRDVEVLCKYVLKGNELSFDFPKGYDELHELVIDPTLIFSTYSGSPSDNWGASSTNDRAGNMFLGGIVLGANFPTTLGAFQTVFGGGSGFNGTDVVITKFNATGTARLYSTFLGGASNELLTSLYCTDQDELIALITTGSVNFPTTQNAYRRQFSGGISTNALAGSIPFPSGTDIAVVKFSASGSALVGSTFFGGSGNDGLNNAFGLLFNYGDESRSDIAVDGQGNIYVSSVTNSPNLPGTLGSLQPSLAGSTDGLVFKMNANLSALSWASYYGGSAADAAYSIKLDQQNNILICGGTASRSLPGTTNGLNNTYRGGVVDGYVAKLNNAGTAIINATYLGTNNYDQAFLLDLDNAGNPVVFGQTLGVYPLTPGTYRNNGAKQFIHKLNNALTETVFSTVFGTVDYEFVNITPTALLVDVCGNIYAVGWGGAINFFFQENAGLTGGMPTTPDAFRRNTDNSDFYLISLSSDGSQLLYASYFGELGSQFAGTGEDHVDGGTSRFDKNGIVYQAVCASCGGTSGFPVTPGVVGPNNNSTNCNMAGFKFRFDLLALQIITAGATPSQGCSPLTATFDYTATRPGTSFFWDFGDGVTSNLERPTHTYNEPGVYHVKFVIRNPADCNPADSTTFSLTVLSTERTRIERTICEGQTVNVGNQSFSEEGVYTVNLQSVTGCDSVVTLVLTFVDTVLTNLDLTICSGESFQLGSQILTASGTYSAAFETQEGCDSLVTLQLTVLEPIVKNLERAICEGQSVTVGTESFSATGSYSVLLTSSKGCDSTVLLSLLVANQFVLELDELICQGESILIGGQRFTQSGNYEVVLAGSSCDTVIRLNLEVVDPPMLSVFADPEEIKPGEFTNLSAITQSFVTYSWTPASLIGAPEQANSTAFILEDTWFVVVVTDENGCSASDSVLVRIENDLCLAENVFVPSAFTPNGDGKNDVFLVRSPIPLESMRLIIYNRWGEQVFESFTQDMGWDGQFKGQPAQAGVYGFFLKAICGEVIIERKGNVTIIR